VNFRYMNNMVKTYILFMGRTVKRHGNIDNGKTDMSPLSDFMDSKYHTASSKLYTF